VQHLFAYRLEAHIRHQICADALSLKQDSLLSHIWRSIPVDSDQQRRCPLEQPRSVQSLSGIVRSNVCFRMSVRVDKTRCDDFALCIHDFSRLVALRAIGPDINDLVTDDNHIIFGRGRGSATVNRTTLDEDICRHHCNSRPNGARPRNRACQYSPSGRAVRAFKGVHWLSLARQPIDSCINAIGPG
jgi:hypothetical protein